MNKTVIVLRACPGAGKSDFADYIKELSGNIKCVICSADDYFTDEEGNYKWEAEKIHSAHSYCKWLFRTSLIENVPCIIISNTNTDNKDVNWYKNKAIELGYNVFVLVIENRHGCIDIHNVPIDVKEKMKENLLNSIKL